MKSNYIFLFFFCFLSLVGCRQKTDSVQLYSIQKSTVTDSAMVVSPHPLATEIGLEILKQGGNAVDAAIAVQFALAVVYPRAGNIGGGGFMVIRNSNGEALSLDYREKAPLKAFRDMYLGADGNAIDSLSREGHLAAGVPGTVDGLVQAFEKASQLKNFKKLIEPAIALAENGYQLTEEEVGRLNRFQEAFKEYNAPPNPFIKEHWETGDLLVQKELAQTLRLIRDNGRAGFYEGETADEIVKEMESGNGIISHEDLKLYRAKWRIPVVGDYKGYRIISMPPPSSGGVALLQLLELIEPYPIADWGFHSPEAIHLMAEVARRVYADRAEYLGDSDFYTVPIDSLLDPAYLIDRMQDYDPQVATISESVLAGNFEIQLESFETTHTSVIDKDGNAVSLTTTLNGNFGCKVMVDGAGFFLNNEMDDFSAKPGTPNMFGLIGKEANAIHPQKRMLSSMTPTIVEKDGEIFMVIGTPGGSTIITAVFQVFVNVVEFGMNLEDAINATRFHHQWLPDRIVMEEGALDSLTEQQVMALGHKIHKVKSIAKVKAIHRLPNGQLHGVADPRNQDDDAKGY